MTIGKYYHVTTPSGSDIMKLVAVNKDKLTFSTYNTFGYGGAKPIKITVDKTAVKL